MENIKITTENLRFFLKVSVTKVNNLRKERAKRLKNFLSLQKNKDKEKKLENNKFFNNIGSIKRKSSGIFTNPAKFSESILEVVSLLLLGTAINNIDVIREKFKELKEKVKKEYEKVKKFLGVIVDATRDFRNFFQTNFPDVFSGGQTLEKDLVTLEDDIKTLKELDNELQKIIDKGNLDKFNENSNTEFEMEKKKIDNSTDNISFLDSLKSDKFSSNLVEPNLLNLDMNAFSQTSDDSLFNFNNLNFNLDLNPKPKRSDFPNGKSGGAAYSEALKKWKNSQKSYFDLIPDDNSSGDNIFVFRQPIIFK